MSWPAALLAESLFKAINNDLSRFRMSTTNFVPWIVTFSITQIQITTFHLTPRWLLLSKTTHHPTSSSPFLLRPSSSIAAARRRQPIIGFNLSSNSHILKIDFFPELQTNFEQLRLRRTTRTTHLHSLWVVGDAALFC